MECVGFKPDAYSDKGYNDKYGLKAEGSDLGSRDILKIVPEVFWFPAEADISIRAHIAKAADGIEDQWLCHETKQRVRSMQELMNIYYKSVGRNANLLFNFPVNK